MELSGAGLTEVKGGGANLLIYLPLSAFVYVHTNLSQLKVLDVGHLKWLITNSLIQSSKFNTLLLCLVVYR